jgi:lipopolysaccharide/colanic/teichoic acid biosynthesis glycosyltransferase
VPSRILPQHLRERFAEQWRSDVNDIPGDASKLFFALGFLIAASKMARIHLTAQKRVFDAVISATSIGLLFPMCLIVALAIKLDSPGPVFFRQLRVGRNGRPFIILKFRTTLDESDGSRVTFIGAWLRRSYFDAIPQLLNVIKGDMSLVGPRPPEPEDNVPSVLHESDLKPGIMLDEHWDHGAPADEERYEKELAYLKNRSLFLDLKIVLKAVVRLVENSRSY